MKKIAILNYYMACGGTEKAMIALLNSLDYSKIQVTLYLLFKEGPLLNDIPKQVDVQEIKFKKNKYRNYVSEIRGVNIIQTSCLKLERKIFKILNQVNYEDGTIFEAVLNQVIVPDIEFDLVCDFSGYGLFPTVVAAELFRAKRKCTWIHGEKCFWLKRTERSLDYFDRIFCVSISARKNFLKLYPQFREKTEVFYNLINVSEIRDGAEAFVVSDIMEEDNVLLTVGRIVEEKGYDIAVKTALKLKEKKIPFTWYFIGDGNKKEELQSLINKYNLQKDIILLGRKDNPYPYMKKCTLYVQPSRNEGYPVVIVEARALGCVIVASDIPSIGEQIIDGVNGYLVQLDEKAFANKIEELLRDKEKREKVKKELQNEKIDYSDNIKKLYNLL